jgi:hypothetical protein
MVYRAVPQCSTKYSPYSLVAGRDMRLPVVYDWKPRLSNKEISDNDYEDRGMLLAKRLHDVNKMAGQQSNATS